jgi:D-amino-acid dehydrogenase
MAMNIAIVGAGIIGVTTAYELAADGHQVTVFERRSAAAEETSFANAGVVAPGYVTPWAAPGMPLKVLSYLLKKHAPVRLALPVSTSDLRWMWRFSRACKLETYLAHRAHLQRLAFYSRERLHTLVDQLQLDYEGSTGYLVLLRSEPDRRLVQPGLQVLRDAGVVFKEIDAAAARQIEPALNPDTLLAGAVHLPDDEVRNCRQFALLLKAKAEALGVKFMFNQAVDQVNTAQTASLLIANERTPRTFDAVVLCAGLASAALLRPLGIHVPLAAVYGYSITAALHPNTADDPLLAPRSALMDERYKVAISRLGNRVRVAGSAEIGGHPDQYNQAAIQTLYQVLQDWFPGAAQLGTGSGRNSALGSPVQHWKGARPMLPDRPPIIGASGIPGLWLNLGHGSSGWALSCGSARALADVMAGRGAQLDMTGLTIS